MTDPISPEAPMKEKLDEETEALMKALPRLAQRLTGHDHIRLLSPEEIVKRTAAYTDAENALRQRISSLISEARKEGADAMWLECDTKGIPHD